MFRVPRNPCRFIPLVSNGYNEKESQRRTSAQIRRRKAQGAADREDGRSRLLRPARQGAGGRSHLGRIRPDGALKERRPPANNNHEPAALHDIPPFGRSRPRCMSRTFRTIRRRHTTHAFSMLHFRRIADIHPPTILLNNMIFPICARF